MIFMFKPVHLCTAKQFGVIWMVVSTSVKRKRNLLQISSVWWPPSIMRSTSFSSWLALLAMPRLEDAIEATLLPAPLPPLPTGLEPPPEPFAPFV